MIHFHFMIFLSVKHLLFSTSPTAVHLRSTMAIQHAEESCLCPGCRAAGSPGKSHRPWGKEKSTTSNKVTSYKTSYKTSYNKSYNKLQHGTTSPIAAATAATVYVSGWRAYGVLFGICISCNSYCTTCVCPCKPTMPTLQSNSCCFQLWKSICSFTCRGA